MKPLMMVGAMALIFSTSTFAYKSQIDVSYDHYEYDDSTWDQGHFNLTGRAYFDEIDTRNMPLNEAGFLTQTSNLYGAYEYDFVDSETVDGKTELSSHDFMGGVEYFNRNSGLYLNANIGRASAEVDITLDDEKYNIDDLNTTHYQAEIGFMPKNNLLFAAGINGYKTTGEEKDNNLTLRTKYVTALSQNGQFLNLEAAGEFGDEDQIAVNADFYINPTWSIGAGYSWVDDDNDTDAFTIRTKKFFNPQVGIGAEVQIADDVNVYGLRGTYRF